MEQVIPVRCRAPAAQVEAERDLPAANPQSPGRDTDSADFAQAFDRMAYVLAALAVGTALLAFRLGRVPVCAASGNAADDGGGTGADR
ncbi:hypothetical protein [Streptomyces collinus]|uniref:hypothetical protein n=1 Tax=Streptomyces collinus TaxID=42684 RepID=UPI0037CDD45B